MHQRGSLCEVGRWREGGGLSLQNLVYDLKKTKALISFYICFLGGDFYQLFQLLLLQLYLESQSINVEALFCRGVSLYVYIFSKNLKVFGKVLYCLVTFQIITCTVT